MDQDQHPDLAQLRAQAERIVTDGRWMLRLTTHVALGGIGAVGIMTGRTGEAVVVRFWDFNADLERLRAAEGSDPPLAPTIHERQFGAKPQSSRSLIAQLALLNVPVLPAPSAPTIDGVLYEIYCEQGQHSTSMRWVSTAPEGWETLAVWFQAAWAGLSNGIAPADAEDA